MYDELVKDLRENHDKYFARDMQAADAIEELSREAEEYKAAYRKERNKRIAENRYLYDELIKVVKEKLLMTPIRIEVPEPPKEGET